VEVEPAFLVGIDANQDADLLSRRLLDLRVALLEIAILRRDLLAKVRFGERLLAAKRFPVESVERLAKSREARVGRLLRKLEEVLR